MIMRAARSFILVLFFFVLFVTPSFAQTPPTNNPYTTPNTNSGVPKNLHTWTQNVMLEVISSMTCQLSGVDSMNPNQKCLGMDQKTGKIGFMQNGEGAIGVMGNMITMLYNTPPIHTGDYFNYIASNFGIAKPSYAAPTTGTGFTLLLPLIKVWTAFRDVSYLVFVLVFIVIGITIMLRIKIDPRTVMSIENQIPKIIIGLILVTFSYAISGFLVDMMYVSINVVYNVIHDANIDNVNIESFNPAKLQGETPMAAAGGLFDVVKGGGINGIANSAALTTSGVIKESLGISPGTSIDFTHVIVIDLSPMKWIPPGLPTVKFNAPTFSSNVMDYVVDVGSIIFGLTFGAKIGDLLNIPAIGALPSIGGAALGFAAMEVGLRQFLPWAIPYLIVLIALLFALFRLWFTLIKAYVFILLDITLAPFWIMIGLLPGSSISFSSWLRDIVANLSAFPVSITMLVLGKVFMDTFSHQPLAASVFVPPLVSNFDPNAIASLIGLGVMLMTPTVVDMMREALKAPQFKYTAAIGQAIGVGSPLGVASQGSQIGSTLFGLGHLPGVSSIPFFKEVGKIGGGVPPAHKAS